MNEIVEQINDHKWVLIHHRWLALVSTILICVSGWIFVQFIPDKYESETRIYIDTETVLKSLLSGIAIDSEVREHAARVMQRTLLVRPNLEKVINETDLKLQIDESNPVQKEGLINQLAQDIQISFVSVARNESSNIYRISYRHNNPQLAKSVVDVLLNIFVETILGTSRKDTFKAQQFLDEQIMLYDQKQREAEEKLKDFKQKYAGIMPEDGRSFYARVNALENSVQETSLALKEAENRAQSLRGQIDSLINRTPDPSSTMNLPQNPLDVRIAGLETKLDELLLQFTELHPDVISARRVLEQLRQQRLEQAGTDPQTAPIRNDILGSPLYQDLSVLLSESQSEISALRTRLTEYQKRRDEMNRMIMTLPEIEAQLVSLNRDYEVTRELYQDLVKRRETSQLTYKAEQTGEELQFKILEPPLTPVRPVSPNRMLLETLVAIGAVIAGVGLALLYEQIRPTFYTRRQLSNNLDLPVLGVVSMFWTADEIADRKQGIIVFSVAVFVLLAMYIALLAQKGTVSAVPELINRFIG